MTNLNMEDLAVRIMAARDWESALDEIQEVERRMGEAFDDEAGLEEWCYEQAQDIDAKVAAYRREWLLENLDEGDSIMDVAKAFRRLALGHGDTEGGPCPFQNEEDMLKTWREIQAGEGGC